MAKPERTWNPCKGGAFLDDHRRAKHEATRSDSRCSSFRRAWGVAPRFDRVAQDSHNVLMERHSANRRLPQCLINGRADLEKTTADDKDLR